MSNNDPLDPTGKNGTKKAPLGDPSAPPNPSTREAVSQASSKGSSGSTGSTTGSTSTGSTSTGSSTGTTASTSTSGRPSGAAGSSGAAGAPPSGQGQSSQGQSSGQKEKFRDELNETGQKVKSEAEDTARSFADSARARAQEQARRQQHAAAGELGGIANALRKTADEVQGQSYLPLDHYARQAADKLDDLSQNLEGSDVRSILSRLERYAREQPGVALGGAIISGFLLARFMRASAEHEGQGSYRTASSARGRSRSSSTSSTGTGSYPGDNSL